jgi:hypothetical protein
MKISRDASEQIRTSRFEGPALPLRFNDRLRARLSTGPSCNARERTLDPALVIAAPPPPYCHRRAGIRQIAKTENDTTRNTAEASAPDSTGNLETIPL